MKSVVELNHDSVKKHIIEDEQVTFTDPACMQVNVLLLFIVFPTVLTLTGSKIVQGNRSELCGEEGRGYVLVRNRRDVIGLQRIRNTPVVFAYLHFFFCHQNNNTVC